MMSCSCCVTRYAVRAFKSLPPLASARRIGTNNLKDPAVAPEEVSGLIAGVMRTLQDHLPDTKVLMLGETAPAESKVRWLARRMKVSVPVCCW